MILDPPKPKRRFGRIVIPILLTAAAIVAIIVSGTGNDTRTELEYLNSMQSAVNDIAIGASSLADVSARLSVIDRVEFVTVTDSIRADLAAAMELANAGPPTDQLVSVNALYRQALQAWNRGVTGYSSAVLVAADEPGNTVVSENIADSLAELRAGDQLYKSLLVELERDDVPEPVAPMPDLVLMPSEGGLVSLSAVYVEAARSPLNSLALRPGLGLAQLVSDPEWVVDPDEQAVVPATSEIVFSVVVKNSGNVLSFPETLTLDVTGGPEIAEQSVEIQPLKPGRRRTIVFDPVEVEPGVPYEVSATLFVTSPDSSLDDNQISVVFTVNEGEVAAS